MRLTSAVFLGCAVAVLSGAESLAADSGQSVVRATYATYLRQGFGEKVVPAFKPYFESGLYALAVYWAKIPAGRKSVPPIGECDFDADPFTATQNGTPSNPVTIGAPATAGARTVFPVAVTLGSTAEHQLVSVVKQSGQWRVWDIVPLDHGKAYPGSSLRTELTRFKNNPACR